MARDTASPPRPPELDRRSGGPAVLLRRISRLEIAAAVVAALVLAVLVALEPSILRAPFASGRAVAFTFGGTALAAVTLVILLTLRVPPAARLVLLGVPFVAVNWWLLSPYFRDEVANDAFELSIADAMGDAADSPSSSPPTTAPDSPTGSTASTAERPRTTPPGTAPAGPVLLGAGRFVGLAGHNGTGDSAVFRLPDGAAVLRFENFDIQNGPDLRVYLVPGADQRSLDGAVYLGALRGNVGDQTYDIPAGTDLTGPWTALVWCEAFSVEFVGATMSLA